MSRTSRLGLVFSSGALVFIALNMHAELTAMLFDDMDSEVKHKQRRNAMRNLEVGTPAVDDHYKLPC